MKHGMCITFVIVLLLSTNTDAKGGGRGGRGGSRGRGMHRGGGGLGWAFSSFSASSDANYGNSFGTKGLPHDSFLSNNQYKSSNGFLISSLFYGYDDFLRKWNDEKDKKWRETTRAPYFDNKIPGDNNNLPVSAVLGAATAFGLVSLLPLNVPAGKPLMYCDTSDLIQSQIRINNQDIYVCNNRKFEILCKRSSENYECFNEVLLCDLQQRVQDNIYCSERTLLSKIDLFCSSTTTIQKKNSNENVTIVNCFDGSLQKSRVSFIPTTSSTTESPYFTTTTTPKPMSFNANFHIFLLHLLGKSEALQTTTPDSYPFTEDSYAWYPEALTIPPETTTTRPKPTTTKLPYVWMEREYIYYGNGSVGTTYRPIPKSLQPYSFESDPIILPNWYKIYTTESFKETTTKSTITSTTEDPHRWMRKVILDDLSEKLEAVPKDLVDIAEQFGPYIPSNWIKVYNGKVPESTTESDW